MPGIKQSISWWCFVPGIMTPEALLRTTAEIVYQAVELVDEQYWPLVKQYGLHIAATNGGLSIERGLNRSEQHAQLERQIRAAIAMAEQWGIPNVIVFSGNREGLDDWQGAEITAEGLSRVVQAAEDAGHGIAQQQG